MSLGLPSEHKYGSKWWCNFWANQELCSLYQQRKNNFDIINIIIIFIHRDQPSLLHSMFYKQFSLCMEGSVLSLIQSFTTKSFLSVLICTRLFEFSTKHHLTQTLKICMLRNAEHCDEQMFIVVFGDTCNSVSIEKKKVKPLSVVCIYSLRARILMIEHWLVFELHK